MFQQTVNLKDKMEKERQERLASQFKSIPKDKIVKSQERKEPGSYAKEPSSFSSGRAQAIDKVFGDKGEEIKQPDLQKISRPNFKVQKINFGKLKNFLIIILFLAVAAGAFIFYKDYKDDKNKIAMQTEAAKWYAVKLINGDFFYGQIEDIKTDPVVLSTVYYDYDQMNKPKDGPDAVLPNKNESGNLRLVKRGKEAYGPDGTLNIVRSQVVFMEPLANDSKVLKAIIENEK